MYLLHFEASPFDCIKDDLNVITPVSEMDEYNKIHLTWDDIREKASK